MIVTDDSDDIDRDLDTELELLTRMNALTMDMMPEIDRFYITLQFQLAKARLKPLHNISHLPLIICLLPPFKGEGHKFTAYSTRGKANGFLSIFFFYPRSLTFFTSPAEERGISLYQCLPSHPEKCLLRFPEVLSRLLSLLSSAGIRCSFRAIECPYYQRFCFILSKGFSEEVE